MNKKRLITYCVLLLSPLWSVAQDTSFQRIIFIGDAGFLSNTQTAIIRNAASKVITDKTAVVFLGNNIYPDGVSSREEKQNTGEHRLRSQFQQFREKGATVYFTPGNRDWGDGRPDGLDRVKKEGEILSGQNDRQLSMVPPDACPGPVVIPVTDNTIMVFLDTEWWLHPGNSQRSDDDCEATSELELETTLRVIADQNKSKTILLITHHPFETYGNRGGKFSWKDNLFPLSAAVPGLYLPLPVVGSLYPLFRKAFPTSEDLHHPSYDEMARIISGIFIGSPNFVQISSHDNGLQLIKNKKTGLQQIVTGIGKKKPYVKKGKYTVFRSSDPGYVVADFLPGGQIRFTFYALKNSKENKAYTFTKEYLPPLSVKDSVFKNIEGDSIYIAAHPEYEDMNKFGRLWFGENYRKAWATPVQLPVFRMSELNGGLKPIRLGGGMQTVSARLIDADGEEYTLRSVEKVPDRIIPKPFRGTFARDVAEDLFSAQHPYSALIVPPIAEAVGVPHAHPVIGVVAPDSILGAYQKLFAGKVSLLEEREPLGKSDNFTKAFKKLEDDNDNSFDGISYLKARMIDLLIADWDRHDDQWRFYDRNKKGNKNYVIVPRDRDQALNLTEGIIPWYGKHFIIMPHVFGFKKKLLPGSKYYLMENGMMNAYPESQIAFDEWMKTARWFKDKVTDEVLQVAVAQMPKGLDTAENRKILETLRGRRDQIPEAMKRYYRFSNSIIDIRGTDKKEFVSISNPENKNELRVLMRKINKHGQLDDTLMLKTYPRETTREIRLYLFKGDDSVVVDNASSDIRVRIIGNKGQKSYNIIQSRRRIKLYDYKPENYFGHISSIKKKISDDSANTRFVPVNLYNSYLPTLTGGINLDDGLLLGVGVRFLQQRGFRKVPYASLHQISVMHSFSTEAFHIKYRGEWPDVFNKTSITVLGDVMAPENKQNFFGAGNNTPFEKTGNFRKFYRARFNLYNISPSLEWKGNRGISLTVGPSLQYYHYNAANNTARFISNADQLHSFDSAVIDKDKTHLGLLAVFALDKRDTMLLPTYGIFLSVSVSGNTGLNRASQSYGQLTPQFSFYKNINPSRTIILADRIGGVATVGKPAFYQYAYLGGQDNLLGYRQFRFAGQYSLYNNLEVRALLSNFGNHLFRGQLGIIGFYDVGRVWVNHEHSDIWHNGVGGGVYIAPASQVVIRGLVGHSDEGWYPYVGIGFRF